MTVSKYCVGGGNSAAFEGTPTVQELLAAFGYTYDPNDPLATQYQQILLRDEPAGYKSTKFEAATRAWAEACMRARALLYCNSQPGDVGVTQASYAPGKTGAYAQLSAGTVATGAGAAASLGAVSGATAGLAATGVGLLALPFVIAGIFGAAHAAAEQQQANALSQVTPTFTNAVRQLDAAVKSGQMDAASALSAMASLYNQLKSATASLTKSCNAFCAFNWFMACIVDISPAYYAGPGAPSQVSTALSSVGLSGSAGKDALYIGGGLVAAKVLGVL